MFWLGNEMFLTISGVDLITYLQLDARNISLDQIQVSQFAIKTHSFKSNKKLGILASLDPTIYIIYTNFFVSTTGTVSTYNYAGGFHLANQNQLQCIRREKGNCKVHILR